MMDTMENKTHERKIKVDTKTKDTRIKRIEARRGDVIELVAEGGAVWVIIPDTDLKLHEDPPVAEYYATDLWFAFRLGEGRMARISVPDEYPDFEPDPLGEPGVKGTAEVYYFVICGNPGDAYPATGNSPPRMIIPPRGI